MKNKNTINLPYLINRDEKAIESEVSALRSQRDAIAAGLRNYVKKFCAWTRDINDGIPGYLVDLVCDRDIENELLRLFLQKNGIDHNLVKLDKVKENYNVPGYSEVVAAGNKLAHLGRATLEQYYVDGSAEITAPEVTKAEKEAIIEAHSAYIVTEKTYHLYRAISALCDYANTVNFNVGGFTQITLAKVSQALPQSLQKYLDVKKEQNWHTVVQTLLPKYALFSGK